MERGHYIRYEWDCEEVAAHHDEEEVIDHFHTETLREALRQAKSEPPDGSEFKIVLVRDELDRYDSLEVRSWAYLVDGALPEHFEDALGNPTAKVPRRFHEEVSLERD